MNPPAEATATTATTATETSRSARVDALFTADVSADGPGAALGVYHRGALVHTNGYGLADLESGQPITPRTPFHVASVSKQFTAFAIALLAGEGRIRLDADIREYLPYVPDFGDRTTITVRHLILHTSGLRNQWMLLLLAGQSLEGRITQQQIVNLVARQQELNFPPGSDHAYSNTGYTLLAEIVFQVTGQTLREFTTERIFAPLGMAATFFFDDLTEVVPGRANSYTRRHDAKEKEEKKGENREDTAENRQAKSWARVPLNYDNAGATSLFTTVADLAAWAGNLTDPVVGDRALIEQVCAGGALDDGTPIHYGFGLKRGELNGRATVSHTGSDAGFRSIFVHFPEHDFTVAVLANAPLNLLDKVAAIADLYLPAAPTAVVPGTATSDQGPEANTSADLSRYVGTYLPEYGTSCRLSVSDDTLLFQAGRGEPRKLVVRVDGTLDFGTPGEQSLIPVLDTAGQVSGLTEPRAGYGVPRHLRRIGTYQASPGALAEYTGAYRSPELDITYNVSVEDSGLTARHLWSNRPLKLSPVLPDRFESSLNRAAFEIAITLVFQRDAHGRVEGLRLHTAGARGIRFDRVGEAQAPVPAASTRARGTFG